MCAPFRTCARLACSLHCRSNQGVKLLDCRSASGRALQLERGGKLEAGSDGEGMAAADPAMLMRVMEVREQIEAARVRLSELVSLHFPIITSKCRGSAHHSGADAHRVGPRAEQGRQVRLSVPSPVFHMT